MVSLICWCLRATSGCGRKLRSRIWRARRRAQLRCWTIWKAKPMRSPHRPSPSVISPSAARSLISISVLPNRIGASAIDAFPLGMLLSRRGRRCRRRFPLTIRKWNNCAARGEARDGICRQICDQRIDQCLGRLSRSGQMERAARHLHSGRTYFGVMVSWSVRAVRRALPHELCGKPRLVAPSPVHADDHARERSRDRRDAGGHPGAPEVRHRRSRSDVLFPFFRPCRAPRRGLADRRARRLYERDRLDPVEPSAAFDALFAAADTTHYPEQYRYMAFRLAHAERRTLAAVVYRDGGPETADLYARYFRWLGGGAA